MGVDVRKLCCYFLIVLQVESMGKVTYFRKKVRQLEARVQEEQQISTNTRKENKVFRLRRITSGIH
ncbi:hypothetical protein GIB67_025925 [Kingdonia uniflora]|uniref:Uncharacterized protein n=1 Tax=Kingdonia uniflora TaxID=39325 RepID=A0A7J7NZA8_9MAGN|nr:hypothetical protein GIB67_025925 [Kingdonia uniflora]